MILKRSLLTLVQLMSLALLACKSEPKPPAPADAAATAAPADAAASPTPDAAPAPADAAAPAPDAAAPAPDAAPDATVADAAATPAEPAAVKLIEAGAEPRAAMRYTFAANAEQVADLAMTTELELGATGQKMPTALPKTRMVLTAKSGAVGATGDVTATLAISEADTVADEAAPTTRAGDKLAEVIRGMKGISGEKLATSRGISRQFALSFPAGNDGMMASAALRPVVQGFERAIDQMTVPFPDEAIGVGAKWEVTQKVIEAGMNLDQKSTFELVAMKDGVASLRFTVVLTAPPGKIESTFAGGMAAEVKRLEGSGEGTIEVDLTKVLPRALAMKNKLSMSLEIAQTTEKRALDVEMRLALEAKSR